VTDAYFFYHGAISYSQLHKNRKEREKDCPNTPMIQVFRSMTTHHYRYIPTIFLYDSDDMQAYLLEKKNTSLLPSMGEK
jgi:hypothetical protein